MNDASRQGPGESSSSSAAEQPNVPQSSYAVVPTADWTNPQDLYSFRAEIPPPPPPPPLTPAQAAVQQNKTLLMAAAIGGAILLIGLLVAWLMLRQDEPPAYFDLGTSNIAAAGLEGRLVARWVGSAEYELHIDPAAPQQLASFSAVAANPPHPLSVDIHLNDSSGHAVCQREILVPFDPQPVPDSDQLPALLPQKTFAGDTVQNVAGADGKIGEIVITGPLNCPAKTYKGLTAWTFSSNFPLIADQDDWLSHEDGLVAAERHRAAELRARALIPKARSLSAPIEGDDVIVSDNPSRGSIDTRDGREFYVGRNGLPNAGPGWQVFPAAIHFHCDTKSNCVLTRSGASSALEARLVR